MTLRWAICDECRQEAIVNSRNLCVLCDISHLTIDDSDRGRAWIQLVVGLIIGSLIMLGVLWGNAHF